MQYLLNLLRSLYIITIPNHVELIAFSRPTKSFSPARKLPLHIYLKVTLLIDKVYLQTLVTHSIQSLFDK